MVGGVLHTNVHNVRLYFLHILHAPSSSWMDSLEMLDVRGADYIVCMVQDDSMHGIWSVENVVMPFHECKANAFNGGGWCVECLIN